MSRIKSVLSRKPAPALEAEDVVPPSVEAFDEKPIDNTPLQTTPDEQEVRDEIDTALDPVDADIMGVSSLTEQTNKYQAVSDVIEQSIQNGGLSVEAAHILNIFAQENGLERVRVRVSNESFTTSSLFESKVALEGIKEFIAEWWEKLKNFLKQARERFMAWLQNALNGSEALKASAEELKEAAANAQPGQGDIEFAKKSLLLIEGNFPNVGSEMARFGGIAESVLVDALEGTYSSAENVAKAVGSFRLSGEGSLNSLIQVLAAGIENPANAISNELTENVDESVTQALLKGDDSIHVEVKASKPFLGNAQLAASIVSVNQSQNPVETLVALAKAMKFSRIEILDLSEESKLWSSRSEASEDKKVPRCSPSDAGKIADGAIAVADALMKMRQNAGKSAQLNRDVDAAGNSVNSLNINEDVESGTALANAMRTIVSSVATYPSQVTGKLVSWFGTTAKTAVDYAKASLKGNAQEDNKPQEPQAAN